MIKQLINEIARHDYIEKGAPVDAVTARIYNIEMQNSGFPALPEDYLEFIKTCNGVYCDGAAIFGLNPQGAADDVLEMNENWDLARNASQIILGEDDMDDLVFDAEQNLYLITQKRGAEITNKFQSFFLAAAYLLKL